MENNERHKILYVGTKIYRFTKVLGDMAVPET